ncbi:procathepsin L-like [Ornithodoros turicata]|uniref:procathepsin L-like n=1 Tax=Ornithodoros turicata TaxID=34597 RepID=UPI003138ACBE
MFLLKSLFALAVACVFVQGIPTTTTTGGDVAYEWEHFKAVYGKRYEPEEDAQRKALWEANVEIIRQHNEEYAMGLHTYTLGINRFSDLAPEEHESFLGCYYQPLQTDANARIHVRNPEDVLPEEVDWRKEGYVTAVKDQGTCSSCWAFSSTGAMEGQHFRRTGNLVALSEQNLVDCMYGGEGCTGGDFVDAFDYVRGNGGIDTEASYPYEAVNATCRYDAENIGATVKGSVEIKAGSEEDLLHAVATVGPVSVAMEVLPNFYSYTGGVYQNRNCSCEIAQVNHAVLAVGYGTEDGTDYWLLKNSWSEEWGVKGYFKLARNKDNMCGVATHAAYPLV